MRSLFAAHNSGASVHQSFFFGGGTEKINAEAGYPVPHWYEIGGLSAHRRQNAPRCRHTYQLYVQQVKNIISKKYDIAMTKINRYRFQNGDYRLYDHQTLIFSQNDPAGNNLKELSPSVKRLH